MISRAKNFKVVVFVCALTDRKSSNACSGRVRWDFICQLCEWGNVN